MSIVDLPLTDLNPISLENTSQSPQNLEVIEELVRGFIPKRVRPSKSKNTLTKNIRGHLLSGLLNLSWDGMEAFLDMIVHILLFLIDRILKATDPEECLKQVQYSLQTLPTHQRAVTARTSAAKNMKRHTEQSLFKIQLQSALSYLRRYKALGLLPKQLIMAIDSNCREYWGRFHNQFTGWMKKAQTDLWIRSRNREGFFFANIPIFICEILHISSKEPRSKRPLPAWLRTCSNILVFMESAGFPISVIIADRGYFEALGFAMAGLNLWNDGKGVKDPPILITPRQFAGATSGKKDCKWDWLLQTQPLNVKMYEMKLHYDDRHLIPNVDTRLNRTPKRDGFLVKTIQVFSFDENRKHGKKDWNWAHLQAIRIQKSLLETDGIYKKYLAQFRQVYKDVQKKTLKSVPQFKNGIPTKRKYKDNTLQQAFEALGKSFASKARVSIQKTRLINRVFVTIFSIPPTIPLERVKKMYPTLVHLYALRWGIENAFKSLKSDFLEPSASTSAIQFLFSRVTAIGLLNEYHFTQVSEYLKGLDLRAYPMPEASDLYGNGLFQMDRKKSAVLSRTVWKMTLVANEIENWLGLLCG